PLPSRANFELMIDNKTARSVPETVLAHRRRGGLQQRSAAAAASQRALTPNGHLCGGMRAGNASPAAALSHTRSCVVRGPQSSKLTQPIWYTLCLKRV